MDQKPHRHIGTADLHRGDHQGPGGGGGRRALKAAGVDAGSWTSSSWEPRRRITIIPATPCSVQAMIGAENAVAFDISAACAGFIFAMNIVHGFFQAGIYKTALIIGAETLSR